MRILFINRMASMERGGGETFDLEIARNLALLGHDITFLTGIPIFGKAKLPIGESGVRNQKSEVREEIEPSNLRSITLRSPYFGWFPWDKVKGGWRIRVTDFTIFEWLAARWAFNRRDQYDIIQVCELPNLVVFLKSKLKCYNLSYPKIVVRLTAPNYHDPRGGILTADGIIASGTSLAKLRARGLEHAENIPNGVDTEWFKPQTSSFRSNHGIATDELVILYVARFQEFKNHAMLVDAFAEVNNQLPHTRLVLVGSGPLKKYVENMTLMHGIKNRVHILGEVPYGELPSIYGATNIKAITSNYESFCFAAIEGMAAGLPVVTTDCGWVPGLIGDTLPPIEKEWVEGNIDTFSGRIAGDVDGGRIRLVPGGIVTGRNDHRSFAAALIQMANSADLRSTCGRWNREKAVREHGWLNSALKLAEFYKNL